MTNPTAAEIIARSNRLGSDPRVTNHAGATLVPICLPNIVGYRALQGLFEQDLTAGALK
jgi:hypothetical protein